jgi:hypothetical protein
MKKNVYIKWKTWSKICGDAQNIFAHLYDHTKTISHDFEMVVLHVYQTNEFAAQSDMDNSKRAMPFNQLHDKLSRNRFSNFSTSISKQNGMSLPVFRFF